MEKETLSKEDMARICAPVTKRPSLAPVQRLRQADAVGPAAGAHARPSAAAQNGGTVNGRRSGDASPVGDVGAPAQR